MSKHARACQPVYNLLPAEVEGFDTLAELALDLRWSWNHAADDLWRQLDAELWEATHNPWVVLQTVSRNRIESVLADPEFCEKVEGIAGNRRCALEAPAWFQHRYPTPPLTSVAYFSMEFMLSEALPIYSGGLGNVAGDQLKAASDLGVPVFGVGLLYQQGYFRQVIDREGAQQALFPYNDPGQLPITPLRQANGEWLRLKLTLSGFSLWLRVWQVQVGRVRLYLLDSNDAANIPVHRGITSELYGAGQELRLKQELILGIGGWQLITALGLRPEVCHLNEGHAAFAALERMRSFIEESGEPFDVALAVTRAGNLFTTHTAVEAGFDRFDPCLIEQYLGDYAGQQLGISRSELLALGRQQPADMTEKFTMACLAIRCSGAVNGVSCLHEKVSRHLFEPLFPHWPTAEIPVGHVTNGVHMPTWDSSAADHFWTATCGKDRWTCPIEHLEEPVLSVSDADLWQFRSDARRDFVDYLRRRLSRQLAVSGASPEEVEQARHLFDPGTLTLGFARRFVSYKRPNLLLHDPDRLLRLLTDPERPVQLVISGKAHPADRIGQAMIQEWIRFIRQPDHRRHVIFLSDYDMMLSERLVEGVDVWINTPRRPWEACGTSGMKVLVNGGINLSELDGWWSEAYSPEVGWALGDGREHGDDPAWDAVEAEALYTILENEVVPEFYRRNEAGLPEKWVVRMRQSMAQLTPRFSANRSVREYTEKHYIPASNEYLLRKADNAARGRAIADWQRHLNEQWAALRIGEVKVSTQAASCRFDVEIAPCGLEEADMGVELYAEGLDGGAPVKLRMTRTLTGEDARKSCFYTAEVPANRPSGDFTVRVIPHFEGVSIPLEDPHILWQR